MEEEEGTVLGLCDILINVLCTEILASTEAVGNSSQLHMYAKFFMCTLGPAYSEFVYNEHPVITNTACNDQILMN